MDLVINGAHHPVVMHSDKAAGWEIAEAVYHSNVVKLIALRLNSGNLMWWHLPKAYSQGDKDTAFTQFQEIVCMS